MIIKAEPNVLLGLLRDGNVITDQRGNRIEVTSPIGRDEMVACESVHISRGLPAHGEWIVFTLPGSDEVGQVTFTAPTEGDT